MLFEMKACVFLTTVCSVVLVIVLFAACDGGNPMMESELPGRYELQSPHFTGSLELKSDHTYIQEFVVSETEVRTMQGKWDYHPPRKRAINRGIVGIYGAIIESDGKLIEKGADFVIVMPVFTFRKRVSLWLNPDGDHAYVKTKGAGVK